MVRLLHPLRHFGEGAEDVHWILADLENILNIRNWANLDYLLWLKGDWVEAYFVEGIDRVESQCFPILLKREHNLSTQW